MTTLLPDTQIGSLDHWKARAGDALSAWGALPLRLIVGYGFVVHGYAKLSRGPETFATVLDTLGVPAPLFFSWVTTITELVGGLFILIGAYVTVASVPLAIVLLDCTVHGSSAVRLLLGETRRSLRERREVRARRLRAPSALSRGTDEPRHERRRPGLDRWLEAQLVTSYFRRLAQTPPRISRPPRKRIAVGGSPRMTNDSKALATGPT